MRSVTLLQNATDVSQFGGKALNLSRMLNAGFPVPGGFVVATSAFNQEGKLNNEARTEIEKLVKADYLYAVRSSALAEDAEDASWAGQFETFLNTDMINIISKVEECHNSTKARAKAYASDKKDSMNFDIAVVVQEMIKPTYAGVLFTQNPLNGENKLITEYVEGLGEELVSGRADPKQIVWFPGDKVTAPFNTDELALLAKKVEKLFGQPQDIEWAIANNKIWLVQTRPITATMKQGKGHYLGEPEDLFYWGPSRANPLYMGDFLAAAEKFFISIGKDNDMPKPPKTLVLFYEGKMVWLSNAKAFSEFTEKIFEVYEKQNRLNEDINNWIKYSKDVYDLSADGGDFTSKLLQAWESTIFAEFSLYGAESVLIKRLERFDAQTRQKIWGAFTIPDNLTFLSRIDNELLETKEPIKLAVKYPWIQDGYDGINSEAEKYFIERLSILTDNTDIDKNTKNSKQLFIEELGLDDKQIDALTFVRKLAEFMDDRKAWMMQTRHLISEPISDIKDGWSFDNGISSQLTKGDTQELWHRYVDFKTSNSIVKGITASNGNKHFVSGKVVVIDSPTYNVSNGKILVVPSTSPSYVPMMRNAKALITDHGGMMSHAAIVAREFGLPCIVGTKQATKILKDGDKVVLDLIKGEVNR